MYLDHLKYYVVCINGRKYVSCSECYDMLSLMSVMSPPPALCNLSVHKMVKLCTLAVFSVFGVNLVSWIVMTCCCCCSPSETYGRKWGDSNFQILTELPVPPHAAGVVGTF